MKQNDYFVSSACWTYRSTVNWLTNDYVKHTHTLTRTQFYFYITLLQHFLTLS